MAEPRTVRVRVAVAVDERGAWWSSGNNYMSEPRRYRSALSSMQSRRGKHVRVHWIEADLPLPTEPEVAASVEGQGCE